MPRCSKPDWDRAMSLVQTVSLDLELVTSDDGAPRLYLFLDLKLPHEAHYASLLGLPVRLRFDARVPIRRRVFSGHFSFLPELGQGIFVPPRLLPLPSFLAKGPARLVRSIEFYSIHGCKEIPNTTYCEPLPS